MSSRRKKRIRIFLMTTVVYLFFSYTTIYAFSVENMNLPIQNVNRVKNMIEDYCSIVLHPSSAFVQNGFAYNGQYSSFVYLLCNNLSSASSSQLSSTYFKRTSLSDLGFQDTTVEDIDLCSRSSFSNDCDIAKNVPKIFNAVINDYVNMKQPNVYGLFENFQTDADIKSQVNRFSSGYFDGIHLCPDNAPEYPQTCKIMQTYIKNVRNILGDVTIFNSSGILAMSATNKGKINCVPTTPSIDIFSCGLYGDDGASLVSFVNLVYNELFYYRLFMAYYLVVLQQNPSILNTNTYMHSYAKIEKTFSTQYMRSKKALSLSLQMMRDIYISFPFHIGFLMYQENLDGFAKSIARIAPPIYTLYDKLRNVQKPQ